MHRPRAISSKHAQREGLPDLGLKRHLGLLSDMPQNPVRACGIPARRWRVHGNLKYAIFSNWYDTGFHMQKVGLYFKSPSGKVI